MTVQTGDFFVVRTAGWPAAVIRWFTRSWANHAGIVLSPHGQTIEAKREGATYGNLSVYSGDRMEVGSPPLTNRQRMDVAITAMRFYGRPYGWLDILSLGLLRWHIDVPWVRRRVARTDRLICSQLVDLAYRGAGIALFDDNRPPEDVTPADLAGVLAKENAHAAAPPFVR
jgi:hypothetical protein